MLTEDELELKKYLEMCSNIRGHFARGVKPEGLIYWSHGDLLLQHGTWFGKPKPFSKSHSYLCGFPRACFSNSLENGVRSNIRYFEGYAVYCEGFPVHHAWNVDVEGNVVDATWFNKGVAYIGLEFPLDYVYSVVYKRGDSCLYDWLNGNAILKKPWLQKTQVLTNAQLKRRLNRSIMRVGRK